MFPNVHRPEDWKRDWDEARIVRAFSEWLVAKGWTVETEKDYIDVVAERGAEKLSPRSKVARRAGEAGVWTRSTASC